MRQTARAPVRGVRGPHVLQGLATRAPRVRACRAAPIDDPVVTTTWLADNLQDVAVLDVRGHVDTATVEPGVERSEYVADYDAYLEGHIPGATFWDWTRDGLDAATDVPVQVEPSSDQFAAAMEAKGVGTDRPVVIYDHGDGMFAARLWWMLTLHGHPRPLVLRGGWAQWAAEGRPSELYEPCMLKVYASFEPQDPRPELRITADELAGRVAVGGASSSGAQDGQGWLIVDTRNPAQYSGRVRRGPRRGRVPGAVSLPRKALLDPDSGWLQPPEQLRRSFVAAGVQLGAGGGAEQLIVLYCNGGVAACTAALALHQLGHRAYSVYDGSWNEWSQRAELPVET